MSDIRKFINIVEDIQIDEGINDPVIDKCIFVIGGPGAGKSQVVKYALTGLGLKQVSVDKFFELSMKKHNLSLSMPDSEKRQRDPLRGKAVNSYDDQRDATINSRTGFLIDGTGADYDYNEGIIHELWEQNYDVLVIFVNTATNKAYNRNQSRERVVPDPVFHDLWGRIRKNIENYKRLMGNNFIEFDNTEDIQDNATNNPKFVSLFKTVRSWLNTKK